MIRLNKKNIFITVFTFLFLLIISGCYTPSPLYGSWSDNYGNKITFMQDNTFTAKIDGTTYDGTYTVIDNVLIFSITGSVTRDTEWDLRGSILYLTWSNQNQSTKLTLYHTAK